MASMGPAIGQQDHLSSLPDELLSMICLENLLHPGASMQDIQTYFRSHSLSQYLRDIANDVFAKSSVLEAKLDIHGNDNFRRRWHALFALDLYPDDAAFLRLVTNVTLSIRCMSRRFFREMVEETMAEVRRLRQRAPLLKRLTIELESYHEDFLDDVASQVLKDIRTKRLGLASVQFVRVIFSDEATESTQIQEIKEAPALQAVRWKPVDPVRLNLDCPHNQDPQNQDPQKECQHCQCKWKWLPRKRIWKLRQDHEAQP